MKKKNALEQWLEQTGEEARRQARQREKAFLEALQARLAREERQRRSPFSGGLVSHTFQPRLVIAGGLAVLLIALLWVFHPVAHRDQAGIIAHDLGGAWLSGPGAATGTLLPGTTLRTPPGGGTLASLEGGRVMVYLDGDSALTSTGRGSVHLEEGDAWVAVRPASGRLAVQLAGGEVVVHGTSFALTSHQGESSIFLASGKITVRSASANHPLTHDEMITLASDGSASIWNFRGLQEPQWVTRLYTGYQLTYNKAYFPSSAP